MLCRSENCIYSIPRALGSSAASSVRTSVFSFLGTPL